MGKQSLAAVNQAGGLPDIPVEHAVVLFHPTDKRVLFALPWGDRTYVGTTDTDWNLDLDHPAPVLAAAPGAQGSIDDHQ